MQLLVDIGNTRLKWRWSGDGALLPGGAEPLPQSGEERPLFSRIWGQGAAPEKVVVSNVAGAARREALDAWSAEHWGCRPAFVTALPEQAGVINGYSLPSALGVDRWCALIGARSLHDGPLCVVDCGTAITADFMRADGHHEGGLIVPGMGTMIRSLAGATEGIRVEAKPGQVTAPLGRSTSECIQAGILAAAAGMVEYTLERMAFPEGGLLLLTGGDAALLGTSLGRPFRLEPDLVFRGLAVIGGLE